MPAELKSRGGKISAKGLALAFAVVVGIVLFRMVLVGGGSLFRSQSLDEIAAETNRSLPKLIDPNTRLERLEVGPGQRLTIVCTSFGQLSELDKAARREVAAAMTAKNPKLRSLMSDGVAVWYKYLDTSGETLLEFSIDNGPKKDANGSGLR
jgi:hypothetical protein